MSSSPCGLWSRVTFVNFSQRQDDRTFLLLSMYVIDEDDIDDRDAYYLLSLEPKDSDLFLERVCVVCFTMARDQLQALRSVGL